MKTISLELSVKSIENAIREIEAYKNSLEDKCEKFVTRLANIGIEVVRATIENVPDKERGSYYVEDVHEPDGVAIRLTGSRILFLEFGAGVIYSNPQNPKAGQMSPPMGVGTYPDQKYAWNLTKWGGGWWYTENGQSIHSYGNPAYMPMYKADIKMLEQISTIAKEVFGG